jgi:hypothetical protein
VRGGVLFEGCRNVGLTEFAGSVAAQGQHFSEVFEALLAENHERCKPPLPRAEVAAIAKSIWHRECESRQACDQPRQSAFLRQPDVILTVRWTALYLREPRDLADLGYLLDLARLIETNAEMPISTGHGKKRAAWVGAGVAEIATRFLCNRWALTSKRLRILLERWQERGLIQLSTPLPDRKQRRIQLIEGWAHIDPTGANLFEPPGANLRHEPSACDKLKKVSSTSGEADNLSRGVRATNTNKKGQGRDGCGGSEERKQDPEWLRAGPFEVLV